MCGGLVCKKSVQRERLQAQELNLGPANSPYLVRYTIQRRVTAKMFPRGVHPCVINLMGASGLKTEKGMTETLIFVKETFKI